MSTQEMIFAMQREQTVIFHLCGIILAAQILLAIISLSKLLMMKGIKAALQASAASNYALVDLFGHSNQIDKREIAEAQQVVTQAARKVELAAETIQAAAPECAPMLTSEQLAKALERAVRGIKKGTGSGTEHKAIPQGG